MARRRFAKLMVFVSTAMLAAITGACTSGGRDVAGPIDAVVLTQNALDLVPGATRELAAVVRDRDGNALPANAIAWTSSDERIATVSAAGLLRAVAPGSANITATSGGSRSSFPVVVREGGMALPSGAVVDAQRGSVSLSIPKGAVSAATSIIVERVDTPSPADPRIIPGTVFSISPSDAVFASAATLTMFYDAAAVPASAAAQFKIYRLVGDRWTLVGGTIATNGTHSVFVNITTLGTYAVLGPATE